MDKLAMIKKAEVHGVLAALIDSELVKIADENVFAAIVDTISDNLSDNYDLNEVLEKTAGVLEAAEELLAAKENLEAAIMEEAAGEVAVEEAVEEVPVPEEAMEPEMEEELEEDPEIDLSDLSEEEIAALEELAKEAQEYDNDLFKTAMIKHHELILKKEAGQIDDEAFVKEANFLGTGLRAAGGYLGNLGSRLAAPFQRNSTLRKSYRDMSARVANHASQGMIGNAAKDFVPALKDTARAYGVAGGGAAGLYGLNKLRGGGNAQPQVGY